MKILPAIAICFAAINGCSPVKKYMRKGAAEASNGNLEKACQYYQKAYSIDSGSYEVNAILGITLADYMEQYQAALPYLQRAERLSPADTTEDLFYSLGKTYHFLGRFDEAALNYRKMSRYQSLQDDDAWFQAELKQRMASCEYAKSSPGFASPRELYLANLGREINTAADEYAATPLDNTQAIFTSRRKDDRKEGIDPEDGKPYESMYVTSFANGAYTAPRRYTIPDLGGKSGFVKGHESIISMNPRNKKVFVFRKGKLLAIELKDANVKHPKKLSKVINFSEYQNHAYLSKDGKTLYFTSEGEGGLGGNDIYKAVKNEDGSWGKPENLGAVINTVLHEESPFISDDGNTLYFSSNGHTGYGEYDVFKSELVNGQWTAPQNAGRPINSTGKDVFLGPGLNGSQGYVSSYRTGGKGLMDIYQVNYKPDFKGPCSTTNDALLSIRQGTLAQNELSATFDAEAGGILKDNIVEYTWLVGDSAVGDGSAHLQYSFPAAGAYTLQVKAAAYCDTCLAPYIACKYIESVIRSTSPAASGPDSAMASANLQNFGLAPVYFDFNKTELTAEDITTLEKNIAILRLHKELKIVLDGYTDVRGSEAYNRQLSLKRAAVVKQYLLSHGIRASQLTGTMGEGKADPVIDCAAQPCTEAQYQLSRRVEFVVKRKR